MVRFMRWQRHGVRPATTLPEQFPTASRHAKRVVSAATTSLRGLPSTSTPALPNVPEASIEHIRNTTVVFRASHVLTARVEMDLFTELAACPRGLKHAQIVELLFLHKDLRPEVLDTLVSLQILVRTGHGAAAHYTNSKEANVFLVKHRHETYIGDTLLACGSTLYSQFINYPKSLRNAKVQCPTVTQVCRIVEKWKNGCSPFSCKAESCRKRFWTWDLALCMHAFRMQPWNLACTK
jgi:Dimerisation domain